MKMICVFFLAFLPLQAEWVATVSRQIIEPSKEQRVNIVYSNAATGAQRTVTLGAAQLGSCGTNAIDKVKACIKDRILRDITRLNAVDAAFADVEEGVLVGEEAPVAPPPPPVTPPDTSVAVEKYLQLWSCSELVRLTVIPAADCLPLVNTAKTAWTGLSSAEKLQVLTEIGGIRR